MTIPRRRLLPLIALAVPVLAGAAVWFWYATYVSFNRVEEAENVARVDWLPAGARNVSYYRSYPFTAYEFDIDEAGFRSWAAQEGWPLRPVEYEPFRVLRYSFHASKRMHPPDEETLAPEEWRARHDRARAATQKEIRRGYGYEKRQSNGGGVTVGYDLDTGRAYYQYSPR